MPTVQRLPRITASRTLARDIAGEGMMRYRHHTKQPFIIFLLQKNFQDPLGLIEESLLSREEINSKNQAHEQADDTAA